MPHKLREKRAINTAAGEVKAATSTTYFPQAEIFLPLDHATDNYAQVAITEQRPNIRNLYQEYFQYASRTLVPDAETNCRSLRIQYHHVFFALRWCNFQLG